MIGTLRDPPPLCLGIVGLLVGVAYVLRIMIPSGMDPTIMLAFGADSPTQSEYAEALVGEVTVRDYYGHDGQTFFIQANDPWFLHPEDHAVKMDWPTYRSQRMGYPMIASGFGLFPPGLVIWTLPLVNILALGAGTFASSLLARQLGGSTWLGLAFCLNPGVLAEVDISGGGAVALAFCVWGVFAAEQGSLWTAAFAFSAGTLSRETILAAAAACALVLWRRGVQKWWIVIAMPGIATLIWGAYVRMRLSGLPAGGPNPFSRPFRGPLEALEYWREDPLSLVMIGVFLAICFAFAVRLMTSRQLLAWAAAPSLVIASIVSVEVWRFPYDIGRVLSPVFLAYPFLAFIPGSRLRKSNADQERVARG